MPNVDYEYTGMVAEAWDLLRGDTSKWGDRSFYRPIIERQGGPALDVGCGTGRLLLDYLAAGLDVDGVDNSPEMLALCRAKATARGLDVEGRLHYGEMEKLALPRRYATIFVPSLSIQLLIDVADAHRAMARFREHLRPGGVLVVSFRSNFWDGDAPPVSGEWSAWEIYAEAERPDGATVRRWIRLRYDLSAQLLDEENRYELLRDGRVVNSETHTRVPSVRWYSQVQAVALFSQAGFRDLRVTGGDTNEPASPDDVPFKIAGVC
jgi:SAM-dependent methyltransferase